MTARKDHDGRPVPAPVAAAVSYLSHLECGVCGRRHEADRPQNLSACHGKPLLARYDLTRAREAVTGRGGDGLFARTRSMWRYRALLPDASSAGPVTLGEGWTPLLPAARLGEALGMKALWVKDEGQNPTGTFKARGMSAAVTRARALGIRHLLAPTAGNAGGALATYAARAGLRATVAMPRDAPAVNKAEVRAMGAELLEVDGLITDAAALLRERAAGTGAFDVSTLREPFRLEGKKTMGFELFQQLAGLPDVIVFPTGGGAGLIGMGKAFDELETLGLVDGRRPRMVAVQSAGCAPLVKAWRAGASAAEPWAHARTIAGGLRVPAAIGDFLLLEVLRATDGAAVAVDDEAIVAARRRFAKEAGLLVGPEAAATLPGLEALLAEGTVDRDETVVLFATGTGLKQLDLG